MDWDDGMSDGAVPYAGVASPGESTFGWKEEEMEIITFLTPEVVFLSWVYIHNCCGIKDDPWKAGWNAGHGCPIIEELGVDLAVEVQHRLKFGRYCSVKAAVCLLMHYVHQKQTQTKALVLRVLLLFVGCAVRACHLVVVERLVCTMNIMPHPMPAIWVCLVICADGTLDGMDGVLQLRPSFLQVWDKLMANPWHGHRLSSAAGKPLLKDMFLVCLWIKCQGQQQHSLCVSVAQPFLWCIVDSVADLVQAHIRCQAADEVLKLQPLQLLSGRSGKRLRNVECHNKLAWLNKLKITKFQRGTVLARLTSGIIPEHMQKQEQAARFFAHLASIKPAFSGACKFHLSFDASMHSEDTVVSVLHCPDLPDTLQTCYPVIQVCTKPLPSEIDDENLHNLYNNAKLKRTSSYAYLKVLQGILSSVGKDLDFFQKPKELELCRPLDKHEIRVQDPETEGYMVYNLDTDTVSFQLPSGSWMSHLPLLSCCIDQGSIGLASVHYLMFTMSYCVLQVSDRFHRLWNDLKLAFQKSQCGAWFVILAYTVIMNSSYGPFGKGTFFLTKQEIFEDFLISVDSTSKVFRDYAFAIATEKGIKCPVSDAEHEELWDICMSTIEIFQFKGPQVKLMRWFSYFEALTWHKGQFQIMKMVLEWHYGAEAAEEGAPVAAEDGDDRAVLNALKLKLGTLGMIPGLISDSSMWVNDMLVLLVQPAWHYYAYRASKVLTPKDGVAEAIKDALGSWQDELKDLVCCAFSTRSTHAKLGLLAGADQQQTRVSHLVDMTVKMLHNRARSMTAAVHEPPFCYASLLGTSEQADATLAKMKADWAALLVAEATRAEVPSKVEALQEMRWTLAVLPRLLFLLAEACWWQPDKDLLTFMRHLLEGLPDSKVIEDVHQKLRDKQRLNRNDILSRANRQAAVLASGVLETRGMHHISCSDEQLSGVSWREAHKGHHKPGVSCRKLTQTKSTKLNEKYQRIMDPKTVASMTPEGMFQSAAATAWIFCAGDTALNAAWCSRLVPESSVLLHVPSDKYYFSVAVASWGFLAWQLLKTCDGMLYLEYKPARPVSWQHVKVIRDWHVVSCSSWALSAHLGLSMLSPPVTEGLLHVALLKGTSFTKSQLQELLGSAEAGSKQTLLDQLLAKELEGAKLLQAKACYSGV